MLNMETFTPKVQTMERHLQGLCHLSHLSLTSCLKAVIMDVLYSWNVGLSGIIRGWGSERNGFGGLDNEWGCRWWIWWPYGGFVGSAGYRVAMVAIWWSWVSCELCGEVWATWGCGMVVSCMWWGASCMVVVGWLWVACGEVWVVGELCGEVRAAWGLWDGRELHVVRCRLHGGGVEAKGELWGWSWSA